MENLQNEKPPVSEEMAVEMDETTRLYLSRNGRKIERITDDLNTQNILLDDARLRNEIARLICRPISSQSNTLEMIEAIKERIDRFTHMFAYFDETD